MCDYVSDLKISFFKDKMWHAYLFSFTQFTTVPCNNSCVEKPGSKSELELFARSKNITIVLKIYAIYSFNIYLLSLSTMLSHEGLDDLLYILKQILTCSNEQFELTAIVYSCISQRRFIGSFPIRFIKLQEGHS